MIKVEFLPPADKELFNAYLFYSDQLEGLELRFVQDFENTMNLIKQFPEAWLKVGENTRRGSLKKFPYFILYIYENDCIYITCIAHKHRDPEYYLNRIK